MVTRLEKLLRRPRPLPLKPLLIIISGFEQFFDEPREEPKPFEPRHSVAAAMQTLISRWVMPAWRGEFPSYPRVPPERVPADGRIPGNRLLLTTRHVRPPLWPKTTVFLADRDALRRHAFTQEQLGLAPQQFGMETSEELAGVYERISFAFMNQPATVPLASAYVMSGASATPDPVFYTVERSERLLDAVRGAPVDRGTRVVRFVVHMLDAEIARDLPDVNVGGVGEALLQRLACFNRPFRLLVIVECLRQISVGRERGEVWSHATKITATLYRLRLLEKVSEEADAIDTDLSYVVHPLVKEYFRSVVGKGKLVPGRAFGLNSPLSRGPFEDPGKRAPLVLELFDYFEREAKAAILVGLTASKDWDKTFAPANEPAGRTRARRLTRAAFELLRSNLSYNTVAKWGGDFRQYLQLCTRCYDLAKNYAIAAGETWTAPGTRRPEGQQTIKPPMTAEEILWLINEIALAYYSLGALRDSLRLWTLAFEWQRRIARRDPEQGVMYAASLYCNLGTMTLIMGRLDEAQQHFTQARENALASQNQDLRCRMDGFLARVDNLRGDLKAAGAKYDRVIKELGDYRNIRAQSYFMRYLGLLNARLGAKDAHVDVYKSLNIAASEDHPDVVADAKYFLGRVYLIYGEPSQALHEFRAALDAAKKYQMGLLETNALVGIAAAELKLGDAYAALETAFFALRRANECLWGLRQVEAMTVIGEAYLRLGQSELGHKFLHHARDMAHDHQFHLHVEDISKLLAAHPKGGLT